MPITEDELREILTNELGEEVSQADLEDFLHEHYPYEQRIGMHDVSKCIRCRMETKVK